jgi:alpha-amylase
MSLALYRARGNFDRGLPIAHRLRLRWRLEQDPARPSLTPGVARWEIGPLRLIALNPCRHGMTILALVLALYVPFHSSANETPAAFFAGLEPVAPNLAQSRAAAEGWHKDAVVYHLWVAAFRDSDGDGIGDLRGIIQSLDTLRELGVNTLWLSPFFMSASSVRNLHGYDVIDHDRVDPRLGTDADVDELIRAAHARGLRLIFDFVPNHLSTRHPWFIESRDPLSPKRDWFIWRDEPPPGPWTGFNDRHDWHPLDGAYYYGIFWSGMPDVNHRNPDVRLALARAARHWLNRGFDGIRMDAVRYLYENLEGTGVKADQEDQPETFAWFEAWRREVMDPYTAEGCAKFMVAENWTNDRQSLLAYLRHEDRPVFQMTLNFPLLRAFSELNAAIAHDLWAWDATLPAGAWLGNFTSNHDLAADRPGTLFAGQPQRLRAQTAWLLLGPGTPFIYYGNEIGQQQGPQRGDTRHRQPLDWDEVARQRDDPDSIWHWHRRLINLRHDQASIRRGKARFLETDAGDDLLVFWREADGDTTLTFLSASAKSLPALTVQLSPELTGQPTTWLLGDGPVPVCVGGTLRLSPLAPFASNVLSWSR